MSYTLIDLVLFILAFLAGYYGVSHYVVAGKAV